MLDSRELAESTLLGFLYFSPGDGDLGLLAVLP